MTIEEKIKLELNNAVRKSIKDIIEQAIFFYNESEIHGYLGCKLRQYFRENEILKDKIDLILRECKTKLCYCWEKENNGIPYKSPRYIKLRGEGYKPRSAKFDLAIWSPNKEKYQEGREPIEKAIIGVEIKRQKKLDLKEEFIKNLRKDCAKLNDSGNELRFKYLVIILYYPEIFTLDIKKDLDNLEDINIVYCIIDKKTGKVDPIE